MKLRAQWNEDAGEVQLVDAMSPVDVWMCTRCSFMTQSDDEAHAHFVVRMHPVAKL